MKLTVCLVILSFVQLLANNSYAQKTKLSVDLNNTSIEMVLLNIENQSNFKFIYNKEKVDVDSPINVQLKEKSIIEVLNAMFEGKNISYSFYGNQIILTNSESGSTPSLQQKPVSGKVTDSAGSTLPGVSVVVKGTTNGTITDANGNYSLTNAPSNAILQFSFVGMKTKEISIDGKATINAKMEEQIIGLEEVVAVGYGTVKKSDLTSAITSVKTENLKVPIVGNITEALQGNAAGVEVLNESNSPGGAVTIRIRGVSSMNSGSSPLYVVDGVPLEGDISFLNSGDIENIEILKDASSAAIYGSRGANGVILVTTKKGKRDYFNIDVEGSYSIQNTFNMTEMADASEFARLWNTIIENDGGSSSGKIENPSSLSKGTDWLDEITGTATIQKYSVGLQGGSANTTYVSSLNYFKQDGIVSGSSYERISGRFGAEFTRNEKLKVGHNIFLNYDNRNEVSGEKDQYGGLFFNALIIDPVTPVYKTQEELEDPAVTPNKNEYSIYKSALYTVYGNPVAQIARSFNNGKNTRALANLYASYQLLPELKLKSNVGVEVGSYKWSSFFPDFFISTSDKNDVNSLEKESNTNLHYTWENTLNYDKQINNNHKISALAGYTIEYVNNTGLSGSKTNIPGNSESLRYLRLATQNADITDFLNESSLISYLARINYNYMSKYLLTASFRADGSSRFSNGNKWGIFPSVSAAWNITQEDFFVDYKDIFSQLKLRGGWGTIGNQDISGNAFYTLMRNNQRYPFGNSHEIYAGYGIQSAGNPDLIWETTEDINVGLDAGLFKQKLSFNIDWYKRTVRNLLLQVPIADFTGLFSSPYNLNAGIWSNAGSMENKGVDVTVNYHEKLGKLDLNIGLNGSWIRNKIIQLNNVAFLSSGNYRNLGDVSRTVVGKPIAQFYGYKTDGIFQTQEEVANYTNRDGILLQPNAQPGDFRFLDIDGSGEIDSGDRDFIGNPLPDFTFGFNFQLEYKGFDLAASLYGVVGNEIMDGMRVFNQSGTSFYNSRKGVIDQAWHGVGTSNTQPRITNLDQNQNIARFSDFYIVDGSYLKLNNISLGYSLGKLACEKLQVKKFRIYTGVQNAFILTKYKGFDPAVSNSDILTSGVDYAAYPMARTFIFGTLISF